MYVCIGVEGNEQTCILREAHQFWRLGILSCVIRIHEQFQAQCQRASNINNADCDVKRCHPSQLTL
jgi:hypothetical protein